MPQQRPESSPLRPSVSAVAVDGGAAHAASGHRVTPPRTQREEFTTQRFARVSLAVDLRARRSGTLLVVVTLTSCGGANPSSTSQRAAGDVPAPMPSDATTASDASLPTPDRPGRCFETFATVVPPEAAPDQPASVRGTRFRFDRVVVGQRVVAGVRFWNFCNASEHDARVLSVEASGADGGALDPGFTIAGPVAPGYVVQVWAPSQEPSFTITFQPRAPGEYFARVVVRFPHGYYDAEVSATAVAP